MIYGILANRRYVEARTRRELYGLYGDDLVETGPATHPSAAVQEVREAEQRETELRQITARSADEVKTELSKLDPDQAKRLLLAEIDRDGGPRREVVDEIIQIFEVSDPDPREPDRDGDRVTRVLFSALNPEALEKMSGESPMENDTKSDFAPRKFLGRTMVEWGFSHPLSYFVFAFVMLGFLACAVILLVWGDGAESPIWRGSRITKVSVCEQNDKPERLLGRAEDWIDSWVEEGWNSVPVTMSSCLGEPESGEVQIRPESYVLDGFAPTFKHHGNAFTWLVDGEIDRGIIYMVFNPLPCTLGHEIGHAVYGLSDTMAATSIMAGGGDLECGRSFALVHRSLYTEPERDPEILRRAFERNIPFSQEL